MTVLTIPGVSRPVSEDSFADLTDLPVVRLRRMGRALLIEFGGELPEPVRHAVVARCTSSVDGDEMRSEALAALQACQDFLALPSPTAAEAIAQVRVLTRIAAATIRLFLRRF